MNRGIHAGLGLAVLRIVLGIIFLAHGAPKLAGGIGDTAGMFASLGIPAPSLAAWAVALLESVGGALLAVGALVTPVALLLTIHMLTGIFLLHIPNGFYVVGPGTGGVELSLLLVAALLAVILAGPGRWTLGALRQKEILDA